MSCRNASLNNIAKLRHKIKWHMFPGRFFLNVLQFVMRLTADMQHLQTFCISHSYTFVEEQEILKEHENLVKIFHCQRYVFH
jgi:hypothetical protein